MAVPSGLRWAGLFSSDESPTDPKTYGVKTFPVHRSQTMVSASHCFRRRFTPLTACNTSLSQHLLATSVS